MHFYLSCVCRSLYRHERNHNVIAAHTISALQNRDAGCDVMKESFRCKNHCKSWHISSHYKLGMYEL